LGWYMYNKLKLKKMKKLLFSVVAVFGMAILFSFSKGKVKLSIKEKIENQSSVTVYYDMQPIVHNPKKSAAGKMCSKFNETGIFPLYYEASGSLMIDLFVKGLGMKSDKFIGGNISQVPIKTFSDKSMLDFSKGGRNVGDLVILITYSGEYKARKGTSKDPDINLNNLIITVNMSVIEVMSGGRTKTIKQRTVASVVSDMIESKECADFQFFTTNFSLESDKFKNKFKSAYEKQIAKIVASIQKEHEKKLKKRNKG